jgi:hypothetical protein
VEPDLAPLPLGRSNALEVAALTSSDGDHAVLVRQGDQPRALLTAESADDRLVLIPLDDRSEMRVDGDALAIWLTQGSLRPSRSSRSSLPKWASAIGLLLLLLILAFAILGSLTFFGWLFSSLGWIR